jgi:ABC-2 type transport system ATP-binding protein
MAPALELQQLSVRYGRAEAVRELSLTVEPGRCHALLGRNGAGKTSTMKALLGLIAPDAGRVKLFGLDPKTHEAEVKSRLSWVPDAPAFYPWMTVQDTLEHAAALRPTWRRDVEEHLRTRFTLDPTAPTSTLSKGQKTQLALTCAVAADPELLVLDEPTTGLDPLVRRQFLEAVIGTFQDRNPQQKTIFVSTHLISEFEGIVDSFTVLAHGRAVLSADADEARQRFCRLRAWFDVTPPLEVPVTTVQPLKRDGRYLELVVDQRREEARAWLQQAGANRVETQALTLEDIFVCAA